jgi:hypothetical protein
MRMACLRLAGGLSGNEYNLGAIIIHGEFNRNMTSMRTFMKTLGLIRSKISSLGAVRGLEIIRVRLVAYP